MLTQFAETAIRYEQAQKETKKNPTVSVPVINRTTGNVVGHKSTRHPSFATLKETQTLMASLSRRLLIDAASAEKRQRLLTKNARAMAASEAKSAEDASTLANLTEEQIAAEMNRLAVDYFQATPETLRLDAIWRLTNLTSDAADDDDYLFA